MREAQQKREKLTPHWLNVLVESTTDSITVSLSTVTRSIIPGPEYASLNWNAAPGTDCTQFVRLEKFKALDVAGGLTIPD
jgi:hypothetical protein